MTKTIQNTNFVQFMHEVVDAVEAGYTLDYNSVNAPASTPVYKVTLIESLKGLEDSATGYSVAETQVNTLVDTTTIATVVPAPTIPTPVTPPPPSKPMGRPKK